MRSHPSLFYYITEHLTSGLIREVASHERDNLVVFYYITVHLTSGLIREVASHERDNLVDTTKLSLSLEATTLIRPDVRCTVI
jgi:hypothetical protein